MNRGTAASTAVAVVSIALVIVVWMFAADAIPPLKVIQTESSGNRFGPWLFTWALVWAATLAAVALIWVCYSSIDRDPRK